MQKDIEWHGEIIHIMLIQKKSSLKCYVKIDIIIVEKDKINNNKWLSMVNLGLEILSNFVLSPFWIRQHFFFEYIKLLLVDF